MNKIIEAVYENGVFKPLQAVDLSEDQRVKVTIPVPPRGPIPLEEAQELLRQAQSLYEGLTEEEIAAMEATWMRDK